MSLARSAEKFSVCPKPTPKKHSVTHISSVHYRQGLSKGVPKMDLWIQSKFLGMRFETWGRYCTSPARSTGNFRFWTFTWGNWHVFPIQFFYPSFVAPGAEGATKKMKHQMGWARETSGRAAMNLEGEVKLQLLFNLHLFSIYVQGSIGFNPASIF